MKKTIFKNLMIAACLGLTLVPSQAETVLKMAGIAPSGSPWGKWAAGVAAKIEEISGGELKIELLLDAQAGDEQTILRQTVKGRMDIAFVSNVPLTLLSKELAVPSAAYLYDSAEQGTCVTYNHLTETLGEIMQGAGVVPLTWMEVGHYIMFSKEPIGGVEDLKGMKIRIAPSLADTALAKAWGAQGVPLGATEGLPALQTGAVSGTWAATIAGIAVGTHKIAPHVTVTNHSRLIGTVAISERTWNGLSDKEKKWLGVFAAAAPKLTAGILGAEKALLGKIEAAGVPVKYLEGEELAAWKNASKGALEEVIAQAGGKAQSVADSIAAAKTACNS